MGFDWVRGFSDVLRFVASFAAAWGGVGALNGLAFAGVLATLGRRAVRPGVTARRAAGWGALGGLLLSALALALLALVAEVRIELAAALIFLGGGATLSALCAVWTLGLGGASRRRADDKAGAPAA